jgi:hypothetical protein
MLVNGGTVFVLRTVRTEFLHIVIHVLEAIRGLKICRAASQCGIPNRVLKHLPKVAINFLTKMFNAVLRRQYLPTAGKLARATSVLKPGQAPTLPSSCRPTGKLSEKIPFSRILSEKSLPLDKQFGFRHRRGVTLHLAPLLGKVNRNFDEKRLTGTDFLDVCG